MIPSRFNVEPYFIVASMEINWIILYNEYNRSRLVMGFILYYHISLPKIIVTSTCPNYQNTHKIQVERIIGDWYLKHSLSHSLLRCYCPISNLHR